MRIVFMGTPDFAVEPLKALYESGHDISLVLTREDKKRGRGNELSQTPVKQEAIRLHIPVITPTKMKDPELIDKLNSIDADVYIVVAYGKILPEQMLELPRIGCINIHASLLPAYRGAAPIQWAILDGQKQTGITTMMMDKGLDTGDILKQYKIDISDDDTGGSLFDKLAKLGGQAIVDTLNEIEHGNITQTKQGEATTEYASMISKDMGDIDWKDSAINISRRVRAFSPWPTAYTSIDNKLLKIWVAAYSDEHSSGQPGTIYRIDDNGIHVSTGDGSLIIEELQLEGKKRMTSQEWIRGYKLECGVILQRR